MAGASARVSERARSARSTTVRIALTRLCKAVRLALVMRKGACVVLNWESVESAADAIALNALRLVDTAITAMHSFVTLAFRRAASVRTVMRIMKMETISYIHSNVCCSFVGGSGLNHLVHVVVRC